jgi:RNA polymerase sigma-70 factor (ECF subfamily)
VLGFSASEVSETLDTTVASVNRALPRARKTVSDRLPAQSQQAGLRQLGDDGVRRVVERYVDAMENHDAQALAALLAEDATFAMPPYAEWWQGRETIVALRERVGPTCPKSRPVPTRANAQPAVAWYSWDPGLGVWTAGALEVLDLDGERVNQITAFVNPELFRYFGLPPTLQG